MSNPEQPQNSSERLVELRQRMTKATADLVDAFNVRGDIGLEIALEKRRQEIGQVRDLDREATVLKHAESINEGPFSNEAVRRFVQLAMDEASLLQAEASGLPLGDPGDSPGIAPQS